MPSLMWYAIMFALVAGMIFYQEQANPADVEQISPTVFLLGLIVRMTLAVVMVTLLGLGVGSLWL